MRRRAMLNGDPGPVFKVINRSISQSNLSTGVPVLKADKDCTFLLDISLTSNPSSGIGRIFKFFTVWDSVNSRNAWCLGKTTNSATHPAYYWYENQQISWSSVTIGTGRYRIVGVHEKNSNTMKLYCKKDTGSIYTVTSTGTYNNLIGTLSIGSSGDAALPAGTTINLCSVYDRILSQNEIDEFML